MFPFVSSLFGQGGGVAFLAAGSRFASAPANIAIPSSVDAGAFMVVFSTSAPTSGGGTWASIGARVTNSFLLWWKVINAADRTSGITVTDSRPTLWAAYSGLAGPLMDKGGTGVSPGVDQYFTGVTLSGARALIGVCASNAGLGGGQQVGLVGFTNPGWIARVSLSVSSGQPSLSLTDRIDVSDFTSAPIRVSSSGINFAATLQGVS